MIFSQTISPPPWLHIPELVNSTTVHRSLFIPLLVWYLNSKLFPETQSPCKKKTPFLKFTDPQTVGTGPYRVMYTIHTRTHPPAPCIHKHLLTALYTCRRHMQKYVAPRVLWHGQKHAYKIAHLYSSKCTHTHTHTRPHRRPPFNFTGSAPPLDSDWSS